MATLKIQAPAVLAAGVLAKVPRLLLIMKPSLSSHANQAEFGLKAPQSWQRTSLQNSTLAAESLRKLRVTEQKKKIGEINPNLTL